MKKTITILLGILLFTSCLKEEVPFQYTIRVYVNDKSNNPILVDDITLTNLNNGKSNYPYSYNTEMGYYEFVNLLDTGDYKIRVHKNGDLFEDGYDDVILYENKVSIVRMTLYEF